MRDAYLDVLPWRTRSERERGLDLALCLGPIKAAHEHRAFDAVVGPGDATPGRTGWLLHRALRRREALPG